MNELKIFEHPKFGKIRTIMEDGNTLFCGKDAAVALGYRDTINALKQHCRWVVKRHLGVQTGTKADGSPAIQQVEMNFITEGDLCRLAAKSELPGASEFESWIFDEVIPSILRAGSYMLPAKKTSPKIAALPEGISLNGLARLLSVTRRIMLDMGNTPVEIGAVAKGLCDTCGIQLHPAFTSQIPGQLDLFQRPGLEPAQ